MSKRKDRLFTEYRHCPICGGKYFYITEAKKLFHKKIFIHCGNCKKVIQVKEETNE